LTDPFFVSVFEVFRRPLCHFAWYKAGQSCCVFHKKSSLRSFIYTSSRAGYCIAVHLDCGAVWVFGAGKGWQKYGRADLPAAAALAKVGTSEISFFCPTHFSAFLKCRVKGGCKISDHPKYFGKTALLRKNFGFIFLKAGVLEVDMARAGGVVWGSI
jgi:hypothetical protein